MRFTLTWSKQSIRLERSELLILRRFAHAIMCSGLRRGSIKQQIQCRKTCCFLSAKKYYPMKPRPVKCRKKQTTDPDVTWTRNLLIWSQTRWHSAAESMHKGFISDKFLSWKNSKIMAKPIKRRMKNICRPLDLKIYIFNCSSQLSSSWVRRFAKVPKVEEEIVVCIRVVRFTHKWRKWSNWWEKRIPDLEELWTCTNVFRIETRQH